MLVKSAIAAKACDGMLNNSKKPFLGMKLAF